MWFVSFTPWPLYRRRKLPSTHWMGWSIGSGTRLEPTAWNLTMISRSSRAWRSGYTDRFPTASIGNLFLYEIRWFFPIDSHFCIWGLDVCRHDPEGTVLCSRSVRPRRFVSEKQPIILFTKFRWAFLNQNLWELQINLGKRWLLRYALYWDFTERKFVVWTFRANT
jgi:hypothetical protein